MSEEPVEPQEEVAEPIEQLVQEAQEEEQPAEEIQEEMKQVPLSALQKERKKRQDLELELQWERQRKHEPTAPPEEDNSQYESATREDLSKSQVEAVRIIEEKLWIKQNPEKYEWVNENLPKFLKQKPNLATAISSASNRYEEASMLMEALTPRQKKQLRSPPAPKEAPGSPSSVPKAASLDQAVDVMNMSDNEFREWRQSQRKRR